MLFDMVIISISTLSFTTPSFLVQTISGAGKPTAEQERVALSPTAITVGTGCSKKKALTVSGGRKKSTGRVHIIMCTCNIIP